MLLGIWWGVDGVGAEFSEGASGEGDTVCVMDQAIQDRIAEGGIADAFVPVLDRHLTREQCRASARAIFDHLE